MALNPRTITSVRALAPLLLFATAFDREGAQKWAQRGGLQPCRMWLRSRG